MNEIFLNSAIATILASLSISVIVFVCRKWISAWIARQATHGFDERIERLKSDLSTQSALHLAAHSASIATHALNNEKRVAAIEVIWKEVSNFRSEFSIFDLLSYLTNDELMEMKPEKLKALGCAQTLDEVIAKVTPSQDEVNLVDEVTPFISEELWKFYSVYRAFTGRLFTFEPRLYDSVEFVWYEDKPLKDLLLQVLPEEPIEKALSGTFKPPSAIKNLLESLILGEMRRTTTGKDAGEEALSNSIELNKVLEKTKANRQK